MTSYHRAPAMPQAFVWRRLHSLMGVWLILYLIEHLLVNSQAALFIGNDGKGFINSVNAIHDLPYLPIIELAFLGFPFFVHIVWGIKYLFTAKPNSYGDTGKEPYLPEYSRNRAYTWQRITSWLLIVGILAHVIHMRIIEYPVSLTQNHQHYYAVPVTPDQGLQSVASRLDVKLFDSQQSGQQETLRTHSLKEGPLYAVSKDFGTAELMMLRNAFKSPTIIALYTLLVLFTAYHAFNGLWTALITWGVTLTERSQKIMLGVSNFLMLLIAFLGLAAVWITYWINLKQ